MDKILNNDEQKVLNEKFLKAVVLGNEEETIEYLNQGASINYKNINGDSAIFVAADRRQLNVFNILLNYEAPNGEKINLDSQNFMGETTLMHLTKSSNFNRYIEELIKAGANPNIPNYNNLTPLIRASGSQNPELVSILLKALNIDVNYKIPGTLTTAFLMATSQGDFETSELLFDAGANPNAIDMQGRNALINALFKNNSHYTKKEKEKFLNLCAVLLEVCDINFVAESGVTAFWIASATRQKEFCLKMLEKNVNVDISHELGLDGLMSPLHLWCQIGDADMIEKVISAGGKLGVKDSNGNTPEAYAFMRAKLRPFIMKYNIDPNTIFYNKDKTEVPIFSLAISSGDKQIELVKQMLNQGAYPALNNKDNDQNEPIIIAISSYAKNIIKELLKTNKIDLNKKYKISKNSEDISLISLLFNGAMHSAFAAQMQDKKYYESLLKAKEINDKNGVVSDIISKEDFEKIKEEMKSLNKFEDNLESYKLDIFRDLIANGAKLNNENEKGNTEIFFAQKPEYINLLTDHGANLFHENKDGHDLLYYSILNNKKDVIPYLKEKFEESNHTTVKNLFYQLAFEDVNNYVKQEYIEKGIFNFIGYESNKEIQKAFGHGLEENEIAPILNIPNINYQDEDGNSPLLIACANGNGYLVGPYLKMGANINLKNNNGETPLMHALNTENSSLIKYLIEKGADIHAVNNDGISVWNMAEELKNKAILNELRTAFNKEEENQNSNKMKP